MNFLFNSISFYFLMPIYIALLLLLAFFNIPDNYYFSFFFFFAMVTLPVILIKLITPLNIRVHDYYQQIFSTPYRFVVLLLCLIIAICGPIDIYVNGFKLLNPATYAEINGIGRYVRHITILCWIFIPVAFILLRSPFMKFFFITYAIIFPILIIDRNRFFTSCYSLFFCLTLVHQSSEIVKRKLVSKFSFCVIPIICVLSFAIIGHYRSGSSFIVPSSGTMLHYNTYPLTDLFTSLPSLMQQIILYITTPIFNFITVASQGFINQDFLLSQFSPFNRESFDVYPYAPILVPRFNVGTEFYPFLLYGGLFMVIWAFAFLLLSFILAFALFKKYPNIFTFLIFIKISYSVLFMGFAPQFYILLNLMFIVLMCFLWFCSHLLRRAITTSHAT
ncbi:hypothetical protein [Legionella sp.]|uniref:hypothetical protein n=1 Tax=Legionella sp. TaxID=459 RepID=UPI003C8EB0B7